VVPMGENLKLPWTMRASCSEKVFSVFTILIFLSLISIVSIFFSSKVTAAIWCFLSVFLVLSILLFADTAFSYLTCFKDGFTFTRPPLYRKKILWVDIKRVETRFLSIWQYFLLRIYKPDTMTIYSRNGTTKIVISYYQKKDMAILVDLLARKGKEVDFDESTAAYFKKIGK
jgi:hypothetical protein